MINETTKTSADATAAVILKIKDLCVTLRKEQELIPILHHVNLTVHAGEIVGLVGESGSGKSMTASAVTQLLPGGSKSLKGSINFCGEELTTKSEKEMAHYRGKEIAMIFQEPMTCLNPVFTVGEQLEDVICTHQKLKGPKAHARAVAMLESVHIKEPEKMLKAYPYELSGGMRQRAMIAIALSCSPKLLIADEPTTALDVTIQAQILGLVKEAANKAGAGVIFISHDLGVIAQVCDSIAVMYSGEIVEAGTAAEVLTVPRHPYTKALLAAIPGFTPKGTVRRELCAIPGMVPDSREIMTGCRFAPRCSECGAGCTQEHPPLHVAGDGRSICCWKEVQTHDAAIVTP